MVTESWPLNLKFLIVVVSMIPAPVDTAMFTALILTGTLVYSLVKRIRNVSPPMETRSSCRNELLARPAAGGLKPLWELTRGSGEVAQVATHFDWANRLPEANAIHNNVIRISPPSFY